MEKSTKFEIAMAEVLHYLKGIRREDIEKIPPELIKFFKENSSKNYECKFDYTKPLKELELKEETKGLIAMICLNYWCDTEEKKKNFIKSLNENEEKYQRELREKYNPDNIFKNKKGQNEANKEKHELIKCEEKNFIQKVLDKIKNIIEKLWKHK